MTLDTATVRRQLQAWSEAQPGACAPPSIYVMLDEIDRLNAEIREIKRDREILLGNADKLREQLAARVRYLEANAQAEREKKV